MGTLMAVVVVVVVVLATTWRRCKFRTCSQLLGLGQVTVKDRWTLIYPFPRQQVDRSRLGRLVGPCHTYRSRPTRGRDPATARGPSRPSF